MWDVFQNSFWGTYKKNRLRTCSWDQNIIRYLNHNFFLILYQIDMKNSRYLSTVVTFKTIAAVFLIKNLLMWTSTPSSYHQKNENSLNKLSNYKDIDRNVHRSNLKRLFIHEIYRKIIFQVQTDRRRSRTWLIDFISCRDKVDFVPLFSESFDPRNSAKF